MPDGFVTQPVTTGSGTWHLATAPQLPVTPVAWSGGSGLLIGDAIHDGRLVRNELTLAAGDWTDVVAELSGRFVLLIVQPQPLLVPDHFATHAVFFHAESATAATSPALLEAVVGTPLAAESRKRTMPLDTTGIAGTRRLIANHCLDLQTMQTRRFWPAREFRQPQSAEQLAADAIAAVRRNLTAASDLPLVIGLTSGRDSRVTLAACEPAVRREAAFYTWQDKQPGEVNRCDVAIARRIARAGDLSYDVLPSAAATDEQKQRYNAQTGQLRTNDNAEHYTRIMLAYQAARTAVYGFGGEVAIAYYQKAVDEGGLPDGAELLTRMECETCPASLAAYERWLSGLPKFADVDLTVELLYIENRLSAWASPKFTAVPMQRVLNPFADRVYISRCLSAPFQERKSRSFQQRLIRTADASLMRFPFDCPSLPRRIARRVKSLIGKR